MALPDIRFVQIQTHSRCNADCVFCPYVESWHAANPGEMPDWLFDKILHDLQPFGDGINWGKVCPYLMQEPMLDPAMFDRVEKIYAAFPRTCVEISTNGTVLGPVIVDKFIRAFTGRRHEIWVSHHGIDAATYEHIMSITYERALENIVRLLKMGSGRLNVKIRGAGQSRTGHVNYFTPHQYKKYWDAIFTREGINQKGIDVDAFTFHDRAGTLLREDRRANSLNYGKIRDIGPGHPDFYCPRIDQWIHIMFDGTIRLCCMDYHGEVVLPNVKHMTIIEYFQSDHYQRIKGMVLGQIESPDRFICKRCISPGG